MVAVASVIAFFVAIVATAAIIWQAEVGKTVPQYKEIVAERSTKLNKLKKYMKPFFLVCV